MKRGVSGAQFSHGSNTLSHHTYLRYARFVIAERFNVAILRIRLQTQVLLLSTADEDNRQAFL